MKSTLLLRPVYHRLVPRIRAHVLICWLALLLARVTENATGHTWDQVAREIDRLAAVTPKAPPEPWCKPPNPPTSNRPFSPPAKFPRHGITSLHPR